MPIPQGALFVLGALAAAAPLPDVALRAGGVGFDLVHVLQSTRDGSLLVGGSRWDGMDFGGRELPPLLSRGDAEPRLRMRQGGFLARVELDGTVRFLVGPDLGADVWAATELHDGRLFAAGIVVDRTAKLGAARLLHRGEDLVGFGVFLSSAGAPLQAVTIGASDDVWMRDTAAAADGVVVVGAFDGRIDAPRTLVARTRGGTPFSDAFVLALAPDGAPRWGAQVGSPDFTDGADRVIALADGTLLVTGTVGREVVFEDGLGTRLPARCGDPVSCPFLWGLDPRTGQTRFHNVLRNGSGMPDAPAVAALPDGGFVVGGGMGRNLRVGSAAQRRKARGPSDEVTLRAASPVSSSWLARFTADGSLVWARRADRVGSSLRALAVQGPHVILVGTGDLGAPPTGSAPKEMRGEGPATLARVRVDDGQLVDAVRFGRPIDAPLTESGDNLTASRVVATMDGRLAIAGEVRERAWLHLSTGPRELVSAGAGAPGFANEMDVFFAIVRDPLVLATPALPPETNASVDAFEGCVARRGGSLIVPCTPRPRSGARSILHTCIDGTRRVGDRRTWTCGALDDEIPLLLGEQELLFLEDVPGGRLALYREPVGVGRCGALERMACRVTARLLDGDGGVRFSHALEGVLSGSSDTEIADVRLDGDTLYVVEHCDGYEIGHRGRCDQLIALDARSGRVLFRSAPLTVDGPFVIAGDLIIGASSGTHGTSKSKRRGGRVVALDRRTGAVRAELAADHVRALEPIDARGVRVRQAQSYADPETVRELAIERDGARVTLRWR